MQDYEMYEGENKKGIINVCWDNINDKYNNSIIESNKKIKYKIVNINDTGIKYELVFNINDVDELYDIVKKYIKDETLIFKEIDIIKKYNYIKTIKKGTTIKIILHKSLLKYFNIKEKDIDKNSIIKSKIYFINSVCKNNNLFNIKKELNNIIIHFNNIIKSNEYEFYDFDEKDKIVSQAINELDILIKKIEDTTTYKYGNHFIKNLKIIM